MIHFFNHRAKFQPWSWCLWCPLQHLDHPSLVRIWFMTITWIICKTLIKLKKVLEPLTILPLFYSPVIDLDDAVLARYRRSPQYSVVTNQGYYSSGYYGDRRPDYYNHHNHHNHHHGHHHGHHRPNPIGTALVLGGVGLAGAAVGSAVANSHHRHHGK